MSAAPSQQPRVVTPLDRERARRLLQQKLGKRELSWRDGARGPVGFLTTGCAAELANETFGARGWSSTVRSVAVDYVEHDPSSGGWNAAATAVVRVELHRELGGGWHEDVGCGIAEGKRSKSSALECARKAAASDALKRALRLFGNWLGNSAYSDANIRSIREEIDRESMRVADSETLAQPCHYSRNTHPVV